MEKAPTLVRVAEVAKLLNVSPKTVTRWAAEGVLVNGVRQKLPVASHTFGGHRLYDLDKIKALAESLAINGGES